MISIFLNIRMKQLVRLLNPIGLGRFIVLVFLAVFCFLAIVKYTESRTGAIIICSLFLTSIFTLHQQRKDSHFLKCYVDQYRILYFLEYSVLALPVFIGLLINSMYLEASILLLLLTGVVYTGKKKKQTGLNTLLQEKIPAHAFEWKSGIRSSFFYMIIIWTTGLIASPWLGSIPVAIFILGVIVTGFNEKGESLPMLLTFEMSASKLVMHKIKTQLYLYSILVAPLLLAFVVFHYPYWYIGLGIYLFFLLIISYSILLKYAFYAPGNNAVSKQIFIALGVVSALLPFLIPVVMLLSIRFYLRSIQTLKPLLHDYN